MKGNMGEDRTEEILKKIVQGAEAHEGVDEAAAIRERFDGRHIIPGELNGEKSTKKGGESCLWCVNPVTFQWSTDGRSKMYCSDTCRSDAIMDTYKFKVIL